MDRTINIYYSKYNISFSHTHTKIHYLFIRRYFNAFYETLD